MPDETDVAVHSAGQTPVGPGTEITLAIDVAEAHLFDNEGRTLRRV